MASAGLRALGTPFAVSLKQTAQLADCLASSSSCSVVFSGGGLPLRLSTSSLHKSGCESTRRRSGSCGNGLAVCAVTALSSSVSGATVDEMVDTDDEKSKTTDVELLACPVCFQALSRNGIPGLNVRAISRSGFKCDTCKKSYSSRNLYLDLTVMANAKVYAERPLAGQELFRSPFVSLAYERGWRQNFRRAGFPGVDKEVKLAEEFLKPTYGGVLLDISCGSGLFTRKYASLGLYSNVIAIDFSESMLRQTYEYIREDAALLESIAIVRADVARLPFATGSVEAVFAGAALHCWPSPAAGVSEISRILLPGGVFVATTFLQVPTAFQNQGFWNRLRGNVPRSESTLRYWKESELEDLTRACGLVNYQQVKIKGFIMITAQKPK